MLSYLNNLTTNTTQHNSDAIPALSVLSSTYNDQAVLDEEKQGSHDSTVLTKSSSTSKSNKGTDAATGLAPRDAGGGIVSYMDDGKEPVLALVATPTTTHKHVVINTLPEGSARSVL